MVHPSGHAPRVEKDQQKNFLGAGFRVPSLSNEYNGAKPEPRPNEKTAGMSGEG